MQGFTERKGKVDGRLLVLRERERGLVSAKSRESRKRKRGRRCWSINALPLPCFSSLGSRKIGSEGEREEGLLIEREIEKMRKKGGRKGGNQRERGSSIRALGHSHLPLFFYSHPGERES